MKYLICSKYKQKNLVEKFAFLFCAILMTASPIEMNGQTKPLDNWDLEVVGKKNLQNETYFDFLKKGEDVTAGINTLLRYGLSKNYELQVGWSGSNAEFTDAGFSQSTRIGVKAYLANESQYLPGVSLIGSFNLTADPDDNPFMPSINVLLRKKIAANFTLTGNYNFIVDEQSGDLSNDFAVNLDVEWTNWLTSYVGLAGVKSYYPKSDEALQQEYIELGFLLWIADGLRLYPFYDIGLGDDSTDIFNIGVIYHFK